MLVRESLIAPFGGRDPILLEIFGQKVVRERIPARVGARILASAPIVMSMEQEQEQEQEVAQPAWVRVPPRSSPAALIVSDRSDQRVRIGDGLSTGR